MKRLGFVERWRVRRTFSKYVSPEVMKLLAKQSVPPIARWHLKCPRCQAPVAVIDIRLIRCADCGVELCIPNRYFRPASVAACALTFVAIIGTGGLVWVSPPVFSYMMLWLLALYVFFITVFVVCRRLLLRISPPSLDYVQANDPVIRLRLNG